MKVEVNKALKIYSKLYVSINNNRKNDIGIPLAFATPYEDNAAGEKRQASADRWAKSYGNKKPVSKLLDNVPRAGFKVTDDIRRCYYGGGNVVFRIEDPDGWEVEIASSNLTALIQQAGIEKGGLIPGKCVWGRAGAVNVLVHESSEEYKTALQAAETRKSPTLINKQDSVIGAAYLLRDGSVGYYLGKMWVVDFDDDPMILNNVKVSSRQTYVVEAYAIKHKFTEPKAYDVVAICESEDNLSWNRARIKVYSKAPLIELHADKQKLTPAQIDEMIDSGARVLTYGSTSAQGRIAQVFYTRPDNVAFKVEELPIKYLEAMIKAYKYDEKFDNSLTISNFIEFFNPYQRLALVKNDMLYMNHATIHYGPTNGIPDRISLPFKLTDDGGAFEYSYRYGSRWCVPSTLEVYVHSMMTYKNLDELANELKRMRASGELKVIRIRANDASSS